MFVSIFLANFVGPNTDKILRNVCALPYEYSTNLCNGAHPLCGYVYLLMCLQRYIVPLTVSK